ncbi:MAG TPA: alpha/beta hydrolase, partial [Phenylobacterium sp.]
QRKLLARFPPASERGALRRLMTALVFCPGLSLKGAYDTLAAQFFSLKALARPLMAYSDRPPAPFEIPVLFIQGDEDIQTPTELVHDYLAAIHAPAKRLVLIPGGGHMAVFAMPDVSLETLRRELPALLRPSLRSSPRRRGSSAHA